MTTEERLKAAASRVQLGSWLTRHQAGRGLEGAFPRAFGGRNTALLIPWF